MKNIEQLKKSIEDPHIKIVSFDIFDTLIVRLTAKAEDIFSVIEHKTGIKGFRKKRERLQAERSIIAEKTQNKPHCNFDEIYECMQQKCRLNLNGYTWQKIKELELCTEMQFLVCNEPVFLLYKYAKQCGKRVVATSDMYLGVKEILPFLENCGYIGFDNIYVSADVGKTKYRLDLFDYVVKCEGVLPSEILHIGDNFKDDVENAEKCGLVARHYKSNRRKEKLSLYRSISAGVSCYLKNKCDSFWYNLGAEVGGPLYCGIIDGVKKQADKLKPDKVFYLSRDGYNLFNIIEETGIVDMPPSEYLYSSRRAMLLCGIDKLDKGAEKLLPPYTFGQSVKELLDYLDMADISEKSVIKCGFTGFFDVIKSVEDFKKFRNIFKAEEKLFLAKAAEERSDFENYLKKTGFLDCNALVFDCGWNGSSQYLLDRALNLMQYNGKNSFIYAGLMDSKKCRRQLNGKQFDTVFFSIDKNKKLCDRLKRSIVLLEMFFGANHSSVWRYDSDGFIEENIESNSDYKAEVLRGITDFVKIAYPVFKTVDIKINSADCLAEVFRLIENPTKTEAVEIGNLENVDGFVAKKEQKKYIARLMSIDEVDANINELYWPQGIYVREDVPQQVKNYVKNKTGINMKTASKKNNSRYGLFKRIKGYINNYGFRTTVLLAWTRLREKCIADPFEKFIKNTERDILKTEPLEYRPLLSFVIPVYNVAEQQLRECINSVLAQTYNNYELILVDDKSTWECVSKVLEEYRENPKITVIYREENGHISRCTNTGIENAVGEYIVFMDCDDTVAPNAVYEITKLLNEDKTLDFIYTDEDKITENGKKRHCYHFKPDWSPDTFFSLMYTNHLGVYRRSIVNEIGGLRVGYEGAQDYDFTLRFTEKTNRVGHIPKILYHWRERGGSIAEDMSGKPYVLDAVFRLKQEALERRGLDGEVIFVPEVKQFRVTYKAKGNPLVSIIIPSKDNYEMLERCILSIVDKTKYKNFEIVVVDNGSNDENKARYASLCSEVNGTYHYKKMQFNFAEMCNIGAELAKGEYLLFLNDDTEVISPCWLGSMVGQASLEHVGAVGAKLLYPDSNNIQHCGIINLKIGPCHAFGAMNDAVIYYFCRNRLDYNYIAVTGACLCVERKKFDIVNGFDEKFTVAYNDVDLCFKLYEKGFYNVVRCDAVLYHYESVSRGYETQNSEKQRRFVGEYELLYKKHNNLTGVDPFYNINLAKNRKDFRLNLEKM